MESKHIFAFLFFTLLLLSGFAIQAAEASNRLNPETPEDGSSSISKVNALHSATAAPSDAKLQAFGEANARSQAEVQIMKKRDCKGRCKHCKSIIAFIKCMPLCNNIFCLKCCSY